MRVLYSIAMYLATPLILGHLLLRGLRSRDYLRRWGERFGRFPAPSRPGGIVVHAVSVGEVNAAGPLIRALLERFDERPLTITTFTPTGSAAVRGTYGERAFHVYAPLDLPGAVGRFFDRVRPELLVVMETEIWPNLLFEARRRGVPVLVANARLSERSVQGYRRLRGLARAALASVSRFAAQSAVDAERLVASGAEPERVEVAGNLKFDVSVPADLEPKGRRLREAWGAERPVWLAGSTHEGEDEAVLAAFSQVRAHHPDALLILVPRHPERFARVASLARAAGLRTALRSEGDACPPDTECFVIDAMGELVRYYATCDVAFVAGSLVPIGGHNVLEPAALGRPVVVGPHTFNFEEIMERLAEAGGAVTVEDVDGLARTVSALLADDARRRRMGEAGRALIESGRGAVARTLEIVDDLLAPGRPPK